MLERLLPRWGGKLFVLALLGFAATDFMITITLSAADATAHLIENPFAPDFLEGQQVVITLALIAGLGIVFLRGFKEAINVAVVLVAVFLLLNVVVVLVGIAMSSRSPRGHGLVDRPQPAAREPALMIGLALLVFPKLALGSPASKPASPSCPRSRAARTTPKRTRRAGSAAPTSS